MAKQNNPSPEPAVAGSGDPMEELKKQVSVLESQLSEANQALQDALELNDALQSQLEKSNEIASLVKPTVEIDGETYVIAFPKINFEGNILSAEDVKADTELAKKMIEMGSGMLRLKK
ncbi:MAG TPA: hypothetical protein PKX86_09620 [Bacteroidia bacterium]|jgi:hypothetical protein|nr:hypothetical protein [Saprospiraceae bacterium]HRB40952.1 hypothetical protein [Bacteroidia bacterium]